MTRLRKPTRDDVEISFEFSPEAWDFRGSSNLDEVEQDIADGINRGDPWAWFCVLVTVRYGDFAGTASLGGCSYLSEEDFMECEGENLVAEALDHLHEVMTRAEEQIARFRVGGEP